MKARGLEFLTIPDTYYEELREQLKLSKVKVEEDLDVLQVRAGCRYRRTTQQHRATAASVTCPDGGTGGELIHKSY